MKTNRQNSRRRRRIKITGEYIKINIKGIQRRRLNN